MRFDRWKLLSVFVLILGLSASALVACEDDPVATPDQANFRVTVRNTAGALQPLTPSVVALHEPGIRLFQPGSPAGAELERVAESGNNEPLTTALDAMTGVAAVGAAPGPEGPILPDQAGSVELQGSPDLRVSLVSMLVCTNDGFTGVDGIPLPRAVGETVTLRTAGYDAGTEQNTEAAGDLVPPCVMATTGSSGGTGEDQPGISEDEVVRHHPGVDADTDGGDILDDQHRWTDPVAEIVIERIG